MRNSDHHVDDEKHFALTGAWMSQEPISAHREVSEKGIVFHQAECRIRRAGPARNDNLERLQVAAATRFRPGSHHVQNHASRGAQMKRLLSELRHVDEKHAQQARNLSGDRQQQELSGRAPLP
jgi:hypothetical protein